ncbi:hypothetical protein [Actinomadura harenae]|uniref:Uncharacterized protein n=1 Tax=Actinomadura harenae TaxID=2483351 RepID=A0A3M2MFT1_9ACTN|nr:hypothetical protein [Actinomadura harenae]RMI47840.1 hypothetical protein EBO15_00675 [Actinomadura harenae]
MTRTEERLRDAFQGAAETIRPGSLTPLTVPSRGRARARARRSWGVPVVVAGALGLILVGTSLLGGRMSPRPAAGPRILAGAPDHVLAIRDGRALVEDGAGHAIARISGEHYEAVAGTGDGRVFFLATASGKNTHTFYRVTLAANGTPSSPEMVRTDDPVQMDSGLGKPERFAANRDGSKLALVGANGGRSEITLIDVRTGGQHSMEEVGRALPATSATWAPDNRTLGYIAEGKDGRPPALYLLDTNTDRLTPRLLRSATMPDDALINVFVVDPDGTTLTAQVQGAKHGPRDDADYRLVRLSATTGRPTGWTARLPSDSFFVKPDTTGRHFLQIIDGRLGRVDDGRFSWVSRATDYTDAAW